MEAARQNELRLLEAGIRRSSQKFHELEVRHELRTEEFVRRYENNQLDETLKFAEWIGEPLL